MQLARRAALCLCTGVILAFCYFNSPSQIIAQRSKLGFLNLFSIHSATHGTAPRDDFDSHGDVASTHAISSAADRLCQRTLLFKLAGKHGFASEYGILLRTAAIAAHFDYQLVVDDSAWNYGRLQDYFEPPELQCKVQHGVKRVQAANRSSTSTRDLIIPPPWTQYNHVHMPRDLAYTDTLFTRLFVDGSALQSVHTAELRMKALKPPLSGNATLPALFRRAFQVEAEILARLWRPNAELRALMETLQVRLGWESGTERKQITIAVHLRLGDKQGELSQYSPQRWAPAGWISPRSARPVVKSDELSTQRLVMYFAAAKSAYKDIVAERGDAGTLKPRLLLMSDDSQAVERIASAPQAQYWEVVSATQIAPLALPEATHVAPPDGFELAGDPQGFHEWQFNGLPEATRVAQARLFLRDLTTLGTHADGLVFTGSSNAGRLMALLAGPSLISGPYAPRLRSVDVRWFPTARYI